MCENGAALLFEGRDAGCGVGLWRFGLWVWVEDDAALVRDDDDAVSGHC